mgnify:CR=1 FL=1
MVDIYEDRDSSKLTQRRRLAREWSRAKNRLAQKRRVEEYERLLLVLANPLSGKKKLGAQRQNAQTLAEKLGRSFEIDLARVRQELAGSRIAGHA